MFKLAEPWRKHAFNFLNTASFVIYLLQGRQYLPNLVPNTWMEVRWGLTIKPVTRFMAEGIDCTSSQFVADLDCGAGYCEMGLLPLRNILSHTTALIGRLDLADVAVANLCGSIWALCASMRSTFVRGG